MNQWLQFLVRQHAHLAAPTSVDVGPDGTSAGVGAVDVLGFGEPAQSAAVPANFIAPLNLSGVLLASGEQAARFLHGQLSNDIEHLPADQARLAAYCSQKGRMLATLLVWRHDDTLLLQTSRTLLPALQQRLQKFILRTKVTLSDTADQQIVLGLAGERVPAALAGCFDALPAQPYRLVHSAAGTLIRMADADGQPRYQWITTPAIAQQLWPALCAQLQAVGAASWRLTEIRSGIPHIDSATQDRFVPQMLNYELVGGVDFRKGCYPGQEIVARSQYLGQLKRRMLRARVASLIARPGTDVFAGADALQPCGTIVNAEVDGVGTMACLVELRLAALAAGPIHLGNVNGPPLQLEPLPYQVPQLAGATANDAVAALSGNAY